MRNPSIRKLLSEQDRDAIRDALEMRAKACRTRAEELRGLPGGALTPTYERLALTFISIAERADKALERFEALEEVSHGD